MTIALLFYGYMALMLAAAILHKLRPEGHHPTAPYSIIPYPNQGASIMTTQLAALPTTLNGTSHQTEETPQQRLERLGPQAVKDCELLSLALGHQAADRAECILASYPKESLIDLDLGQLARIDGITRTKARMLIAAFEFARRSLHRGLGVQPVVSAPGDCLHYLTDIKDEKREHFVTLYLNARNQVIHKELTSIGSLSSAIVHPREVLSLWRRVVRR